MKVDILTLFPDMFAPLNESIILRAQKKGKISINLINIRDFSTDSHQKTDDAPFGGGSGMVMSAQPICDAIDSVITSESKVIYMSPRGVILDQAYAAQMSNITHLILICGHYEGIDQRILDIYSAKEVSIGDYILTGGELPAMVLVDTVCRLVDGVISKDSLANESFTAGMLEHDQYTRPAVFRGLDVPEVLLSGNHALISEYRAKNALQKTIKNRPDLIKGK